jgi:hypothetical protein
MSPRLLLLACLLGVAGCATSRAATDTATEAGSSPSTAPSTEARAAPAATAETVEPLRFAWPASARVKVVERVSTGGPATAVRYDAVLAPHPSSGGSTLRLENFELVEVAGRDFSGIELPAELQQLEVMLGLRPTVRISPEGEYVGSENMDEVIENMLMALPAKGREGVRRMFSSPELRASLEQASAEFWQTWVGAWTGVSIQPGQTLRSVNEVSVLSSTPVLVPVTMRHLGPAKDHPGAIELQMETVLEGEEFRQSMAGAMAQLFRDAEKSTGTKAPEDVASMLKEAKKVGLFSVVTDPATLRPVSARSEETTLLVMEEGGRREQREKREVREYTFTWP